MNIPGFTVAKKMWSYPCRFTGETRYGARIEITEDNALEGPPTKTFYASLESDGGVFLKSDNAFYENGSCFALSAKQVAALRILFAAEPLKP